MSPDELLDRLCQKPFKPFCVRLSDNATINVLYHPGAVVVGLTKAVMPLEYVQDGLGPKLVLRWKTVELDQIVELLEL